MQIVFSFLFFKNKTLELFKIKDSILIYVDIILISILKVEPPLNGPTSVFNIEKFVTLCYKIWILNIRHGTLKFFFSHFKISMESRPCSVQMYERNKIHLDNYKYQITNIQSWRLMPVPNVLSMFKIDKRSRSSLVAIALAQSVRTVGNRALKLMPRVT